MQDLSHVIRISRDALRVLKKNEVQRIYDVASIMYDAMIQQYDYLEETGNVQQQYRICQLIDTEILMKLRSIIVTVPSTEKGLLLGTKLSALHKKFYALSARRILRNFAFYIEASKRKRVWDKTMPTMECIFEYADEFQISNVMNIMRVSCMPGLGKSYFGNLFVAQAFGNNPNLQILRITYSDDLVKITTKQTKTIMRSKAYAEIFPRYAEMKNIFRAEDKYSFCLVDCEDEYNLFGFTREGQATGKRGKIVVIDDLLKGQTEANNVQLHKSLLDRYYSDWSSRADDDQQKTLLLGTMWADTDLLNVLYDTYRAEGLTQDREYPYVEVTEDRSGCFIRIPALDRNEESTCPLRYASKYLKRIRKEMSHFLWMAVYQQNPVAPEGLAFTYNVLQTYDKVMPINDAESRYATLDPARRGKNYVAMPICYKKDNKHYLVDFLYQKKDMKEMYDQIVDKIIEHRINRLVIENNTDTSLREVLVQRLKEKGYLHCTLVEIYSTKNKEIRIKDNQSDIRNYIIFPAKGIFSLATDMGLAMQEITSYSFDYPSKYDDGIDALTLYAMNFIDEGTNAFPRLGTFTRSYF